MIYEDNKGRILTLDEAEEDLLPWEWHTDGARSLSMKEFK